MRDRVHLCSNNRPTVFDTKIEITNDQRPDRSSFHNRHLFTLPSILNQQSSNTRDDTIPAPRGREAAARRNISHGRFVISGGRELENATLRESAFFH